MHGEIFAFRAALRPSCMNEVFIQRILKWEIFDEIKFKIYD